MAVGKLQICFFFLVFFPYICACMYTFTQCILFRDTGRKKKSGEVRTHSKTGGYVPILECRVRINRALGFVSGVVCERYDFFFLVPEKPMMCLKNQHRCGIKYPCRTCNPQTWRVSSRGRTEAFLPQRALNFFFFPSTKSFYRGEEAEYESFFPMSPPPHAHYCPPGMKTDIWWKWVRPYWIKLTTSILDQIDHMKMTNQMRGLWERLPSAFRSPDMERINANETNQWV